MSDRFKYIFDKIHAEENLKEKTKDYLRARIRNRRAFPAGSFSLRPLAAVAASVLLFVFVAAGFRFYFTPSVVISIDINPSIELGVNVFNRVISVTGYNEDGQRLASGLYLTHKKYEDALDIIMRNEQIGDCLRRDEIMAVTVVGKNENLRDRIFDGVKNCTSSHRNIYCYSGSFEKTDPAHKCGLSRGKYQAYLKLRSLGSGIQVEEIGKMTMKQIRNLIVSLSDSVDSVDTPVLGDGESCGNGTECNVHKGRRYGGGHGRRERYRGSGFSE